MTDPQINFAETLAKWQAEREAANKAARGELLPLLRALGITEVVAEYEGYGDSGNIEDVTVQPAGVELSDELNTKVEDFAWSVAYHQHPGFENNEGGYGTLTWDVIADSIALDHADRYVECSHSFDEGL
ncbi:MULTISPECIES: DUF6878 family protein [Salipiger]|uniref:DUF6878 domain-containing protein n=1 Tax=Salipiger profundus TaxID=1229727 RepID=A0A1U7DDG0_9RHOB|nr:MULTISPECIES: DUF6878 family protein [Salipiger]APX26217.1 hypothetical protein Ga0080559_TMP241 [Salipiger profundus]GGA23140.1 hypothetical protein GCM10011326_39440 [Salipiger profundus]